jgi:hypothetical protein
MMISATCPRNAASVAGKPAAAFSVGMMAETDKTLICSYFVLDL